ncbi:hypothetical protein B2J88_51505 [Rhodococcus sp. SRB_17]|nr:hypothetical protein [Rhodococcus sp. SRB_17]
MLNLKIYDSVRITTDRYSDQGAPEGSVGYIIDIFAEDAYNVEFSDPATGVTVAWIIAHPDELEGVSQ